MTLELFDRKLLEFIYFLTQQKVVVGPEGVSKIFGVSERTMRRWLAFLKKQRLDYYFYIDCRSLGLSYFEVVLENVKNEALYSIVPHHTYFMKGQNLGTFTACAIISYWMPDESKKQFRDFWRTAEKLGLAKCRVFEFEPPVEYYTPFHEIFSGTGNLKFEKDFDFTFFSRILRERKSKQALNPLCVPIIFERFYENWSPRLVWLNAKKKLGEKASLYFKNERSEGARLIAVKREMDFLQKNFGKFFRQIRLYYGPFNAGIRISAFAYFNYAGDITDLAERIAGKTIMLNVRTSGNKHSFFFITDAYGFNYIVRTLADSGCSSTQLILRDEDYFKIYWKKRMRAKLQYQDLFDPKTGKWKFEHDMYAAELKKLAKGLNNHRKP